jgi:hypothetical protein
MRIAVIISWGVWVDDGSDRPDGEGEVADTYGVVG